MGLARKTNLLMVGLALVTLCHVAIFVSTASTGEPERLSGSTSVSATAAKRVPWKSSRVVGSPSPPAPLRALSHAHRLCPPFTQNYGASADEMVVGWEGSRNARVSARAMSRRVGHMDGANGSACKGKP